MADPTVICANPDCKVGDTNKCIEGLELTKCPQYGKPPIAAPLAEAKPVEEEATQRRDHVLLPSAALMATNSVNAILRSGDARVIATIGPYHAGKTSLIASMYDLFQREPADGLTFTCSRTLHAFEQACHHARAVSQRKEPSIDRTPRGEVKFYHIGVDSDSAGQVDLLLGDRAGEEYMSAIDNAAANSNFVEIQRADVLTLLIDGERLLDAGTRHNVRSEALMVVQALVDGNGLGLQPKFGIVLTKFDKVLDSPHKDRANDDFEKIAAKIIEIFKARFSSIKSFKVASSPASEILPRAYGVPELLRFLTEPIKPINVPSAKVDPKREFERLVVLAS